METYRLVSGASAARVVCASVFPSILGGARFRLHDGEAGVQVVLSEERETSEAEANEQRAGRREAQKGRVQVGELLGCGRNACMATRDPAVMPRFGPCMPLAMSPLATRVVQRRRQLGGSRTMRCLHAVRC
eukprot:6175540-Pleurochrysis_carterae.AAC.1